MDAITVLEYANSSPAASSPFRTPTAGSPPSALSDVPPPQPQTGGGNLIPVLPNIVPRYGSTGWLSASRDVIHIFGGVDNRGAITSSIQRINVLTSMVQQLVFMKGPSARYLHATAAHPKVLGRTVTYGGCGTASVFEDMWEWDREKWVDVRTTGASPGKRQGHQLQYSSCGRFVYILGGSSVHPAESFSHNISVPLQELPGLCVFDSVTSVWSPIDLAYIDRGVCDTLMGRIYFCMYRSAASTPEAEGLASKSSVEFPSSSSLGHSTNSPKSEERRGDLFFISPGTRGTDRAVVLNLLGTAALGGWSTPCGSGDGELNAVPPSEALDSLDPHLRDQEEVRRLIAPDPHRRSGRSVIPLVGTADDGMQSVTFVEFGGKFETFVRNPTVQRHRPNSTSTLQRHDSFGAVSSSALTSPAAEPTPQASMSRGRKASLLSVMLNAAKGGIPKPPPTLSPSSIASPTSNQGGGGYRRQSSLASPLAPCDMPAISLVGVFSRHVCFEEHPIDVIGGPRVCTSIDRAPLGPSEADSLLHHIATLEFATVIDMPQSCFVFGGRYADDGVLSGSTFLINKQGIASLLKALAAGGTVSDENSWQNGLQRRKSTRFQAIVATMGAVRRQSIVKKQRVQVAVAAKQDAKISFLARVKQEMDSADEQKRDALLRQVVAEVFKEEEEERRLQGDDNPLEEWEKEQIIDILRARMVASETLDWDVHQHYDDIIEELRPVGLASPIAAEEYVVVAETAFYLRQSLVAQQKAARSLGSLTQNEDVEMQLKHHQWFHPPIVTRAEKAAQEKLASPKVRGALSRPSSSRRHDGSSHKGEEQLPLSIGTLMSSRDQYVLNQIRREEVAMAPCPPSPSPRGKARGGALLTGGQVKRHTMDKLISQEAMMSVNAKLRH